MTDPNYDTLIVGGGLIGLLVARAISESGTSVAVVERGALGSEASWAGGGILSPLYPWRYPAPVRVLADWGQRRYAALCQSLAQETGIDPEWTANGLLMLDVYDQQRGLAWAAQHDVDCAVLSGSELLACEPSLSPSLAESPDMRALWLPHIAQVRNPRLLKALRASLQARGVRLLEHTPVTSLRTGRDRITGVTTPTGNIDAGRLVVAAGAWSGSLLASLGLLATIAPVCGQMLLLKSAPGKVRRMVLYQDRYVIPRRDGRVLVGSTLEHTGFDKATTTGAGQDLHHAAQVLVPGLADCLIEQQWAGLRPGTASGVPYIGPHPHVAGLYICAGHYRNGLVLGLASAQLLADLMQGRPPIVDPKSYALPA